MGQPGMAGNAAEIHGRQGFERLVNQASAQSIQNPESNGIALVILGALCSTQ